MLINSLAGNLHIVEMIRLVVVNKAFRSFQKVSLSERLGFSCTGLNNIIKDLKIEDGSCQRRLPEVILSLEKLVRMSEPVDNGVLDL